MCEQTIIMSPDNITADGLCTMAKLQGATTNNRLSDAELSDMIDNMKQRTESIVDPEQKQRHTDFIEGLRCVLNE